MYDVIFAHMQGYRCNIGTASQPSSLTCGPYLKRQVVSPYPYDAGFYKPGRNLRSVTARVRLALGPSMGWVGKLQLFRGLGWVEIFPGLG